MENVNLIIFGAPGSGKGTYASRLQTKLGLSVVAMGDIFREVMKEDTPLSRKIKGFVEKGLLVPDDVVVEVLKAHLAKIPKEKGLILDGFPRTVDQAKALEAIANIDAVILLTVPDWIIIERLSTRRICKNCGEVYNVRYLKPKVENICDKCGGNLYQRSDDTAQVIKDRINVYEKQTHPLLQFYREKNTPVVEFKCEKLEMSPEVAVEEILKGLKRLKLV
ncbi:MAG: nucleoside monophosphate kinase [Candidatus Bathyarchaeota archaeon]|jgi:adenylate kinase|nr:nucleoside monophosphate kinase [Candidatus Bathyarchaeota archaeon]